MTQLPPDNLPVGLHPEIPEGVYRAHPAVNYSILKHGEVSCKNLKAAIDGLLKKPGSAVDLGSAVHALVLQPEQFDSLIAVKKKVDGRTKEGKAYNEEFEKHAAGKTIIDENDLVIAKRMNDAVRAHPAAAALLEQPGAQEVVLRWTIGDIQCKARCDLIIDGMNGEPDTIIDIKTTADASPAEFARSIGSYGYHMQAAWYMAGYEAITGWRPNYRIIAVESEYPHDVVVYKLGRETLAIGSLQIMECVKRYAECQASGEWPGYADGELEVGLPIWAIKRFEEDQR